MSQRFRSPEWERLDRELRDLEQLLRRTERQLREQSIRCERLEDQANDWRRECVAWQRFGQDFIANMNGDLVAVWAKHHRVTSKL